MTTREEVARKAGVSVAAVSYVLNNKPGVSDATRQKVLEAIRELDYKPSHAARTLKTKKTNQLTVFVNYLGDAFEAGILNHLEMESRMFGYFVNFQTYHPEREEELRHFMAGRIDGVFLLGQSLRPETLETLHKAGIPVISVMKPVEPGPVTAFVDIDWTASLQKTIRHLKSEGHLRIGLMANLSETHAHRTRTLAFRQAMKAEGLPFGETDILSGGGRLEAAKAAMLDYIRIGRLGEHTAFVAASDLMAIGMLTACRESGIAVPDRLAIAGCENVLMTLQTTPTITVLDYPRPEASVAAVRLMVEAIRGEPVASRLFDSRLLVRQSTHMGG
ncbi:LacI family DNA-binding transcriptional regulator [Paenibacillus ginsengarvi]|uniref:LacI family transcriptional regulator n=1 Tax=Paenibacillus ginsengarvi TaxID=400777 RepID=A0A3B0CG75_9BACL|nr:LacI family DNA-binding transcriptional regulator [Paenibacillus ginsengarvi]RKN84865.1 LacI family transcriptional regulator [Paenibacillus ginsengarvi]